MTAKVAWIEAIAQRPAIRWRSSRSARRDDSVPKRSVSSPVRPIVFASSTPDTDSDSSTSAEMSASELWVVAARARRRRPIRRVISTNTGSSAKAAAASSQFSRIIATEVAMTVVRLETIEVAVVVTTLCTPPMSLEMRDCTSPVRVRVKNASDSRWRWRVDGGAQVVHHLLADEVRLPRLGDTDRAGDDRDHDHAGDRAG